MISCINSYSTLKPVVMPIRDYQKEMKKLFNRFDAIWTPDTKLELGGIIRARKGVITKQDTLSNLGISINKEASTGTSDYFVKSENEVDVKFKLAGSTENATEYLAKADAGIILEFNKKNAVVFAATNATTWDISNLREIEDAVLVLEDEDRWDNDYLIITQLFQAEHTTILVSKSKGRKVEIKGDVNPPAEIAKIETQFLWERSANMEIKVGDLQNATPLFRAVRLKRKELRSKNATFAPTLGDRDSVFEAVDINAEATAEENFGPLIQ
jgi:hypothetical protein